MCKKRENLSVRYTIYAFNIIAVLRDLLIVSVSTIKCSCSLLLCVQIYGKIRPTLGKSERDCGEVEEKNSTRGKLTSSAFLFSRLLTKIVSSPNSDGNVERDFISILKIAWYGSRFPLLFSCHDSPKPHVLGCYVNLKL